MMKFGRVSKETRGVPLKDNWYEDMKCITPGMMFYIPPERCAR